MGSPLGPLLANIFMGKLEAVQLRHQINGLRYYGRYVDDIFAIAPKLSDISMLLHDINQAHPAIKFTLEEEQAGSLPFLDVLLSRRPDDSIRRSVYRKRIRHDRQRLRSPTKHSNDVKNKFYEGLYVLMATVLKADKLTVFGDFFDRVELDCWVHMEPVNATKSATSVCVPTQNSASS
nr:unnamed protein product [Spirometra erinaceieuropaei]